MAILNCPECGQRVSDRAETCIHCGFSIGKCIVRDSNKAIKEIYALNPNKNDYLDTLDAKKKFAQKQIKEYEKLISQLNRTEEKKFSSFDEEIQYYKVKLPEKPVEPDKPEYLQLSSPNFDIKTYDEKHKKLNKNIKWYQRFKRITFIAIIIDILFGAELFISETLKFPSLTIGDITTPEIILYKNDLLYFCIILAAFLLLSCLAEYGKKLDKKKISKLDNDKRSYEQESWENQKISEVYQRALNKYQSSMEGYIYATNNFQDYARKEIEWKKAEEEKVIVNQNQKTIKEINKKISELNKEITELDHEYEIERKMRKSMRGITEPDDIDFLCDINGTQFNLVFCYADIMNHKGNPKKVIMNLTGLSESSASSLVYAIQIEGIVPTMFSGETTWEEEKRVKERKEREREEQEKFRRITETNEVRCPKCGSTAIQVANRGHSFWLGERGAMDPVNYCMKCGHKWTP